MSKVLISKSVFKRQVTGSFSLVMPKGDRSGVSTIFLRLVGVRATIRSDTCVEAVGIFVANVSIRLDDCHVGSNTVRSAWEFPVVSTREC
jgi:hypothetical protein